MKFSTEVKGSPENTTATLSPSKKKYKLSPTPKQRKVARIMVDVALGKRPDIQTTGDIVVQAGYAPTVKDVPHKVLKKSGVQDAIQDLGFNEETAKKVVQQILNSETAQHKDRLKAADMVFKVNGTYAAEKRINVNVETTVDTEKLMELAAMMRKSV